nr:immunoglobulin light chain junction region [Macaca mulatta]
CMQDKALPFTF